MSKRKAVTFDENEATLFKKSKEEQNVKKHSLDSDEEDENDDAYNILNDDDIEGEEEGISRNEDGVRTTAFNMREEMEEGYFDKDGHFVFSKKEDIRDNWLDNIDWHDIKNSDSEDKSKLKSLGDESESDDEENQDFDEVGCYIKILEYMKPKESITKSLRRLGAGNKRLSSVERLKLKKAGILDANTENVTKLTELANNLLIKTGNMDIYEETYEHILQKINKPADKKDTDELDMYSEDFDKKEKQRLDDPGPSTDKRIETDRNTSLMWEFKWSQDTDEIEGPSTTEQMQNWVNEGKFKSGVWVRKCGQDQFYSSSRIDFELYLS